MTLITHQVGSRRVIGVHGRAYFISGTLPAQPIYCKYPPVAFYINATLGFCTLYNNGQCTEPDTPSNIIHVTSDTLLTADGKVYMDTHRTYIMSLPDNTVGVQIPTPDTMYSLCSAGYVYVYATGFSTLPLMADLPKPIRRVICRFAIDVDGGVTNLFTGLPAFEGYRLEDILDADDSSLWLVLTVEGEMLMLSEDATRANLCPFDSSVVSISGDGDTFYATLTTEQIWKIQRRNSEWIITRCGELELL